MGDQIKCNVEFIKKHMDERGISLNKLSKEIGISPATLSRVMNGKRNPGQMVMGRMIKYFGVKFDVLFSYDFELTKVNEIKKKSTV